MITDIIKYSLSPTSLRPPVKHTLQFVVIMRHKEVEVVPRCDGNILDKYAMEIDGQHINYHVASEAGKVRDLAIM